MNIEEITSANNPKIKRILRLQKFSKDRINENVLVIEGSREIHRALISGFEFESIYICNKLITSEIKDSILNDFHEQKRIYISENIFSKIAYREGSDGIFAIAINKKTNIDDLNLPQNPLLLVIENVEKPGNIGAMLRTADAAAVDAVIICNNSTDLYNPNIIRSSLGCVFSLKIVECETKTAITYLNKKNIRIFATVLSDKSKKYTKIDYTAPSAIVLGSEANGLSQEWREASQAEIIIPMLGIADSLNVSVTAAVVIFEAKRQRNVCVSL